MNLLIPNLGSTSLKYQILEMPSETVLAKGRLERVTNYREAIAQISTGAATIDAVALKAVHGGPKYRGTFVVDDEVTAALRQFLPAAPAASRENAIPRSKGWQAGLYFVHNGSGSPKRKFRFREVIHEDSHTGRLRVPSGERTVRTGISRYL